MRIKVEISYNGKNYKGWQIQPNAKTVQGVLEKTLKIVLKEDVKIIASGRTDSGVSAIKQIAHFDVQNKHDFKKMVGQTNFLLPEDIRILSVKRVKDNFNARFDAKKKKYIYNFYESRISLPFVNQFALQIKQKLNIVNMKLAAQYLIGEHDFTSFCASGCEIEDKTRSIFSVKFNNYKYYKSFEIEGNGFLFNMVRIIMGTLIDVGKGKISPDEFKYIIEAKERKYAGATVSAKGLVLKDVKY